MNCARKEQQLKKSPPIVIIIYPLMWKLRLLAMTTKLFSFQLLQKIRHTIDTLYILSHASKITGLTVVGNSLMLKGAPVPTVSIYDCLSDFILWAQTFEKPVLLYGHNVKFDAKTLVRACCKVDLVEKLKTAVVGFSDTVPIFKTILPNNSGYTQESVVAAVLGKSYDAHNSLADAKSLRDVVIHCEIPKI